MTLMQKIIDKLASKKSFCCEDKIVKDMEDNPMCDKCGCEVLDEDIRNEKVLIGDVLEKCIKPKIQGLALGKKLIELWGWCGFTRSLQEIAECGYEEVKTCKGHAEPYPDCGGIECGEKRLKNPSAQALAEFINSII